MIVRNESRPLEEKSGGAELGSPLSANPAPLTNDQQIETILTAIRMAARDTNLYTFARADGGPLPGAMPVLVIDPALAEGGRAPGVRA